MEQCSSILEEEEEAPGAQMLEDFPTHPLCPHTELQFAQLLFQHFEVSGNRAPAIARALKVITFIISSCTQILMAHHKVLSLQSHNLVRQSFCYPLTECQSFVM